MDTNSTEIQLNILNNFDMAENSRQDNNVILHIQQNISLMNLGNLSLQEHTIERIHYPDFSQIVIVRALFVCMFLFEFVVSVLGNLLVCVTIYRNKSMHSAVNYGIVNLGICDFLVGSFVLPTKLFELTAPADLNMMNDVWCTVIRFLETIVIFVSVFTLVAICIERYYAVVFPMHSRIHMTKYRIRKILLFVWIIPIIVAAPNLYPAVAEKHYLYSDYGEFTRLTCFDTFSDQFRKWYYFFLFVLMYIFPLLFIGTTCFSITRALMRKMPIQPRRDPRAISLENGRRKVAKMVLVIVFAFIVCWSPYFLVTIVTQFQAENFLHTRQFFFTMLSINLLCFTNSCVNPFVYFAMSARFRKGFLCIIQSMLLCPRRRSYSADTSLISLRSPHYRTNGHTSHQRRYIITPPSRTKRCSCQPIRRTPEQRGSSLASHMTLNPNKLSGNSQGHSASYHRHLGRHSSDHTIVFEFHRPIRPQCDTSGVVDHNMSSNFVYKESSFLL